MGSGELEVYDLFELKTRVQLPPDEDILVGTKVCVNGFNFFAASLKKSCELLIVSDGIPKGFGIPEIGPVQRDWYVKPVPWFQDPLKKISSLAFDGDGMLYIGTKDGCIFELSVTRVLDGNGGTENLLKLVFHLDNLKIIQLVVWHRENIKMILCNGDNCKLAIVHANALPVLVTFLSSITHLEIFTNNAGLSCLLVCLENNTNVYCVLDDLEIPSFEPEIAGKKSLFRKAKDNIMSKFSEDKMNFFNRSKGNKDQGQASVQRPSNIVSSTSLAIPGPIVGSTKQYPVSNVKFFPVEDVNCRGILRRIIGRNQFSRHVNNKLDIFDSDFRQTAAVYIPNHISRLYIMQKIFFGVDEEQMCIRISTVHNGTMKEFSHIPLSAKILSIDAIDHDDLTLPPYSVFVTSSKGIFEVCLRKTAVESCVDLLLAETNSVMLDVVCLSLNVAKTEVCMLAGDIRAQEGKFAKAILYYKIAGLGGMKIMAKFGARGHIPAMLCFYELMEQEQRNKLAQNAQDRISMTNLALIGRVEQYLRHGKSVLEILKSPKYQLRNMLLHNPHYSAKHASLILSNTQLMWALQVLGMARLCYPDILSELHRQLGAKEINAKKAVFWDILASDWLAVYSAPANVFNWLRHEIQGHLKDLNTNHVVELLVALIPWRRELHQKLADSNLENATQIIEIAGADRIGVADYVTLFLLLLLEFLRRNEDKLYEVPNFSIRATKEPTKMINKRSGSPTDGFSDRAFKTLSISNHHCACIRNGKIFTWGENKFGRLGHPEDGMRKPHVEFPVVVDASLNLRISFVAVSTGINHNLALTSVGTIFTWGSNALGQLGLGSKTQWTARPIPLVVQPNLTIIHVAAGGYHSVAIDHLNRVWTWGWGVHGQLGDSNFENCYRPQRIKVPEKIVSASAGHSHTALLSVSGNVYTFGCAHFGQLGQGLPQKKVKMPTLVDQIPQGTTFKLIECGFCSTAMVATNNKLYYTGLNPNTLRTLLSGHKRKEQRNNAAAAGIPQSEVVFEEEKDYSTPVTIGTAHLAGEIVKVDVATTHMVVLTSAGMVYTWGLGKSGQLVRPDDDHRTLELIEVEDKMFIASDIGCGGDCTFVIEKESHRLYGCGFNSSGQLGKLQTDDDSAVMTIKTKKRVVKVRQPSNIYLRLREIGGLPKPLKEVVNLNISPMTAPCSVVIDQDLLEWFLKTYKCHYHAPAVTQMCLEAENYAGAAMIESMVKNHEFALKHSLCVHIDNKIQAANLIENYLDNAEKEKSASVHQAVRFLRVVIEHWSKYTLLNSDLEKVLVPYQTKPPWNIFLNCALKEIIASADDSAKWIAANMTPLFILTAIKESKNGLSCGLVNSVSSANTSPTTCLSAPASVSDASSPIVRHDEGNLISNGLFRSHSHNAKQEEEKSDILSSNSNNLDCRRS